VKSIYSIFTPSLVYFKQMWRHHRGKEH